MTLPATPFWFLRHGETDYNARGLSQGAVDIPLNATGHAQAAAAAPLLANRGITAIHASPMLRTRETTAIVNQTLRLPVHYAPDLREVTFGGMEGKPMYPWFTEWLDGRAIPNGAETFAEVTRRAGAILTEILKTSGPVLIVAHGGIFRAIRVLMGIPRDGPVPNAAPLFCEHTLNGWRVSEGK